MKAHFIGIGGIGVSALAQYYFSKGHIVSGSDLERSQMTDYLKAIGIKIIIGKHLEKNITKDIDLVIHSPAVRKDNSEFKKAKKLKIKTLSYPKALGKLTKEYFTIAVSGTHGKSTTTAMISLILEKAGLDPTVVIGTKLKEFNNSNFRPGNSKYLVMEADEHFSSFLNYSPDIMVLTNIEKDHLDYYKNLNNILKAFREYTKKLKNKGVIIANRDDKNVLKVASKGKKYGIKDKEAKYLKKILKVSGRHNVYNALAALAAARVLNIDDKVSFKALSEYKGAWRRFDICEKAINGKNIVLINDYAHHPTEVLASLEGIREKFPNKKICCIFQPHQRQRTFYLFKEFVKSLKSASRLIDKMIIADIYDVAGRETKAINKKISSKNLAEAVKKENVFYLADKEIIEYIKNNIETGNVLIIMGAGDIYNLNKELGK